MKSCCVIGSIHMDLVTRSSAFVLPGQTIIGHGFATFFGGKGANQAIALGRLGANVSMAGCVGQDSYGDACLENFKINKVKTESVTRLAGIVTGLAAIEVEDSGENRIVVMPGAGGHCTPDWFEGISSTLARHDIFLLQLEIPLETVILASQKMHTFGKTVILDPAPAQALSAALLRQVDIITPNTSELQALGGVASLLDAGVGCVLHKDGGHGATLHTPAGTQHFPAYAVDVVDTTAAGDAFNAGLAMGLSQGLPMPQSIRLACAVGALAVTQQGAQAGLPTLEQARVLMRD